MLNCYLVLKYLKYVLLGLASVKIVYIYSGLVLGLLGWNGILISDMVGGGYINRFPNLGHSMMLLEFSVLLELIINFYPSYEISESW